MNLHESGIVCTKSKLWKKKKIIISIIDYMIEQGYEFQELVFGEPNNFVFADQYHEIENVLKRKGFFGIRIKFKNDHTLFEINSNTNGVDNVKYDIFTEDEVTLEQAQEQLEELSNIIGSTSETLVKSGELIQRHRRIRLAVLIVALAIGMYFLNVHLLLLNIVELAFSFFPLLFILLLIDRFRRR